MKNLALPADLAAETDTAMVSLAGVALPKRVVHRPTGLSLTLVPPGCFAMGSPDSEGEADERPRHEVELSKPFYLGTTPVTRGEWRRLAHGIAEDGIEGVTGFAIGEVVEWHFDVRASWRDPLRFLGFQPTDDHPVTQVAWHDAQQFCRRHGLRLPTEAEFEWAHRGGTTTRYWWGDDPAGATGCGNYCDRSMRGRFRHFRVDGRLLDLPSFDHDDGHVFTSAVGTFAANPFGLRDIGGNVWEWCEDVYDPAAYTRLQRDGHAAIGGTGPRRVLRGASWDNGPRGARCARRYSEAKELRLTNVGFRIVRDVVAATESVPGAGSAGQR